MTLPTKSPMGSSMEPPSPIEPRFIINMPQEPTEPGPKITLVVEPMLNPINEDQNDIRELGVNAKDSNGNGAPRLHLAVEGRLFEVTSFLIRNGAYATDTENQGNTVLHASAQCQENKIENKIISLRRDRRWAVRDLNLSNLKLVTNALNHLDNEEQKQRVVCQPQQTEELLLFVANNNVNGNLKHLMEELTKQEYECHKTDRDQGYQCVLNQVDDISGSDYILDAFEAHYPKSRSKKLKNLVLGELFPILGLVVMGVNIGKDAAMTEALLKLKPNGTHFQQAYHISCASQFLHLTTTFPFWLWTTLQWIRSRCVPSRSCGDCKRKVTTRTSSQPSSLENNENGTGSAERPLLEENGCMSCISHSSEDKQLEYEKGTDLAVVICPVVVVSIFMAILILSGLWSESDGLWVWVWVSNLFSMTVIVVVSAARFLIKWKMEFGQGNLVKWRDLRNRLDRKYTLTVIGESCFEAGVQFILQIWLFSQQKFAKDLKGKFFIMSMYHFVYSLLDTGADLSPFEVQVMHKLLLSSTTLTYSVTMRHLASKNYEISPKRMPLICLSNIFQLWARIVVVLASSLPGESASQHLIWIGCFFLFIMVLAIALKLVIWSMHRKEAPFSRCNLYGLLLSSVVCSLMWLRIPMLNRENKTVTIEDFGTQLLYLFVTLRASLLCLKLRSDPQSNSQAYGEVLLLFGLAIACHIGFYTLYGHPSRASNRKRVRSVLSCNRLKTV